MMNSKVSIIHHFNNESWRDSVWYWGNDLDDKDHDMILNKITQNDKIIECNILFNTEPNKLDCACIVNDEGDN